MEKSLVTKFLDFCDRRDVDKHVVSALILAGTYSISQWAMRFADTNADKAGLEIAAIIAAVVAPYMAVQGAAIKFYFDSRPTELVNPK